MLGRVEGRGVDGRASGREPVLGFETPPSDGRFAEGRLAEGLETLESEGRELGLDPLGLDMFGRDTLGRDPLGLELPVRPIDGRDLAPPPDGRDLAPPPDGRDGFPPPRPLCASATLTVNRQSEAASANRPMLNVIFLFMIEHLSYVLCAEGDWDLTSWAEAACER